MAEGGCVASSQDGAWDRLVQFWNQIAMRPLGDPEDGLVRALGELCELVDGDGALVVLTGRVPRPHGGFAAVRGWRPIYGIRVDACGDEAPAGLDGWLRTGAYATDPAVLRLASLTERSRSVALSDLIGEEPRSASPIAAACEQHGVVDAMVGRVPVAPEVEVVLAVHRSGARHRFSAEARRLLDSALRGMLPLFTSLTRSTGYLDAVEPLTPRERVVLSCLLTGRREADIATQLGMGRRSLHQRVSNIYRKFGVASRPQLMALWLNAAQPPLAASATEPPLRTPGSAPVAAGES